MKIFLSALENGSNETFEYILKNVPKMKYNLMSFYYLRDHKFEKILKQSELILIDSGAHSFQKGKKVDWVEYTKQYADWIEKNDCEKIIGYFEMDVDNIIRYEKVLELRKILERKSNKIIPVWHKNRGIQDFKEMCQKYRGKIIAITGFRNEDIKDEDYIKFLAYVKKYDCKVHCLGMTREKVLDKVPFDFVDSSSWKQRALYGKVGKKKVSKKFSKENAKAVTLMAYKEGMKMQEKYEQKWKNVKWR